MKTRSPHRVLTRIAAAVALLAVLSGCIIIPAYPPPHYGYRGDYYWR